MYLLPKQLRNLLIAGNSPVRYINKLEDRKSYNSIMDVARVFVVSPDRYHCEIAGYWRERITPIEGKIYIEKPLDSSLEAASDLAQGDIKNIFVFDHYLAKFQALMNKTSFRFNDIGQIQQVLFDILESKGIPFGRTSTLESGVILDLYCHVLAIENEILSLNRLNILDVKGARYEASRINDETFASIKTMDDNHISSTSNVGKCVDVLDRKFLLIRGDRGEININFKTANITVNNLQITRYHGERSRLNVIPKFLNNVLNGKENPWGTMPFNIAFCILRQLVETKGQIGKLVEYRCGESLDNILNRFL